MKIRMVMQAIGLSMKEIKGKNGNKFYQLSIDQDGEAGVLPITEEMYKANVSTFKKYSPVSLTLEYNDQYKYMRCVGLSQGRV